MTSLEEFPDADALAEAVGQWFVARLAQIQSTGRVPAVCLTGGSIADKIHQAVAALDSTEVDWKRVDFFWGDERYVPADSSDRNDRAAGLDLLDKVGVDPARVYAMPASDERYESLEEAAAAYEDVVRTVGSGSFDVVMLGMGPDGHVASLFPGHPQLDVTDRIAVPVTESPKPPPERISLTFPALNRTKEVWFLVSGDGKADAVARALSSEGTVHATPARGITVENTTWFLDAAAAGLL